MLFDKVIAFDHVRQKLILIVNMELKDPGGRISQSRTGTGTAYPSLADRKKERRTRRKNAEQACFFL